MNRQYEKNNILDTPGVIQCGMYISLNEPFSKIIQKDIELFRTNIYAENKHFMYSINKFLNQVFINMCDCKSKSDDDYNMVKQKNKGKKQHLNIKINKTIINKMRDAEILKFDTFTSDLAKYYMYYIISYASLPFREREKIFYKQIYNDVNNAIEHQKIIKIKTNKYDTGPRSINGLKIYTAVLPYKIVTSEDNGLDYIAGFALNGKEYQNTVNIPLHSIFEVSEVKTTKEEITFKKDSTIQSYKEMEEYMNYRLNNDGIMYLSGNINKVTVKLTNKGIDMLFSRNQYKPNVVFDTDDPNIITFEATRLQTFLFFFKFGENAEILEPPPYREYFINNYTNALNKYKKEFSKSNSNNDE